MLQHCVSSRRIDSHGSETITKDALIVLDIDRADAFNPLQVLLGFAFVGAVTAGLLYGMLRCSACQTKAAAGSDQENR